MATMALAFFAEKLPAEKALEWGMIYQVVPPTVLLETATSLARQLAAMPTRGLALTKRLINASADLYARVKRLDDGSVVDELAPSPARALMGRLERGLTGQP